MLTLQTVLLLALGATCHAQYFTCPSLLTSSHQDETNCNAYWYCQNGQSTRRFCNAGEYYDPLGSGCGNSRPSGCTDTAVRSSTANINSCTSSNAKFPDYTDCSSYFWCQNWVPYKQSCGSGKYFDQNSGNCYSGTPPQSCLSVSTRLYTADNKFYCPDGNTVKYADKYDCRAYYECKGYKPTRYLCQNGQLFDPTYRNCYSGINPSNCQMTTTYSYLG